MKHRLIVPGLLATNLLIAACSGSRTTAVGPYTPANEQTRNASLAEALNAQAARLMDSNHGEAERLLREALTADLYFGPAHNNLGVLMLRKEKYYEAASEFEWARKLMPGHPDPRMNLALTLEQAGRDSEALDAYHTALEVQPGHLPSIQGLARLQVRTHRISPHTHDLLDEIALRGETAEWREWAKWQRIRLFDVQ